MRDPLLPLLDRALDAESAGPPLAAALAPRIGPVRLCEVALLRHKPGRRAVVAYAVEARESGLPRRQAFIGKLHHRGADRTAFALLGRLRAAGLDGSGPEGVGVPEPVALVPELGLWLQRRVPGASVLEAGPSGARAVGRALARLHAADPVTTRRHTVADELALLGQRLASVPVALPHLAARISRILEGCRRLAARMASGRLAGIHRDFYQDQVLVESNRVWLLDLDLYACGDPALDAGNFIGHLVELGLREQGDPATHAALVEAFADAYLSLVPTLRRPEVECWVTLCLARHLEISTRFEARRHTTVPLLELVEARLGQASPHRTARTA